MTSLIPTTVLEMIKGSRSSMPKDLKLNIKSLVICIKSKKKLKNIFLNLKRKRKGI